MKIDFNKPYGHVQGGENGEAFEQAGILFDGNGNAIGLPEQSAEKRRGRPPKESSIDDQIAAQGDA